MEENKDLSLKWAGMGGNGDFLVSDVVAIRLFEAASDKLRPDRYNGDTTFIYPNDNGNGSLVSDADTYDADYKYFSGVKHVFIQAGAPIPMINKQGEEFLVSPKYKNTVSEQLTVVPV